MDESRSHIVSIRRWTKPEIAGLMAASVSVGEADEAPSSLQLVVSTAVTIASMGYGAYTKQSLPLTRDS